MTTGLISHPLFLDHQNEIGHPECPERLTAILQRIETTGTINKLVHLSPNKANAKNLQQIHSPEYIDYVKTLSAVGEVQFITADTSVSAATYDAAVLASGGVLTAVDAVISETVDNAFCAHRPPGHHAEHDHAMGFCVFNHVAVAARYLQIRHGIKRIAIIDWDVHHGNGTQHAFQFDPNVFFFSVHQYPHYPGTGAANEQGQGLGKGTTLNVPIGPGTGDNDYIEIFSNVLRPAMDTFKPEFVLVSAGFDAHKADPLSAVELTQEGYLALTKFVLDIAAEHCDGRFVSLLEGGYNLEATSECVDIHLLAMCD